MQKAIRKTNPFFILVVIILFHLITTYVWLKIDKSYLKLDAWGHYRYSLEVYDFLKGIQHFKFPLSAVEPLKWHGLLVGFISAFLYFIFGNAQDTAVLLNSSVFLIILILSVFGIARKILSIRAGLFATFIITLYPIIYNNFRIYMLDLPLTSMVTLSLYFLFASENFSNKKSSLLFGLSCGLGLLIKFNFLAFIIGPFIITVYQAITKKTLTCKNAIRNILYFAVIIAFLCGFFYIVRFKDMLQRIYDTSNLGIFKNYKPNFFDFLSWRSSSILKFVEIFINQGISFLFLIAFTLGFLFFIKGHLKDRWKLYLVLIVPLFIQAFLFSIPPECMLRYSMPILSVLAIITSIGLLQIKNKICKITFIFLLVIFGLTQFFSISYGIAFLPERIKFTLIKKLFNFDLILFQQNIGVPPFLEDKTSHPSTADWKSTNVLNAILNFNVSRDRIKVVLLSNIPELSEAMDYKILRNRYLIDLIPAISITSEKFYEKRPAPLDMICIDADFIIISDNNDTVWEMVFNSNPMWKKKIYTARTVFFQNINYFKLIDIFNLPDGNNLLIYKNVYKSELLKLQEIQYGNIKLLFDNGRARLFYKGIEITKGLGLYASLFSLQHWRDSMEATWEVKKLSDTKLVAQGRWMFIPVVQTWEIELKEGNVIDWHVKTDVLDIIKIEAEDFKLMLSDNYKSWFLSDGKKGAFPVVFEESSWKQIWTGDIKNKTGVQEINIENFPFPSVIFYAYEYSPGYIASIENSDRLFDGRVIGCFKKNILPKNVFSPGDYEYFSAQIMIE